MKIRNVRLYTGEEEYRKGCLVTDGAFITYAGPEEAAPEGGEVVDGQGGILMPGLCNAHTHAAMVLFRGVGSDLALMDWLDKIVPLEEALTPEDLSGERIMVIHRGWNGYIDRLRDDISRLYPQTKIVEFDFFSLEVFNRCEKERALIVTIDRWHMLHPMLKTLPVAWDYTVPYGFLHAPEPNDTVARFLGAVEQVVGEANGV